MRKAIPFPDAGVNRVGRLQQPDTLLASIISQEPLLIRILPGKYVRIEGSLSLLNKTLYIFGKTVWFLYVREMSAVFVKFNGAVW